MCLAPAPGINPTVAATSVWSTYGNTGMYCIAFLIHYIISKVKEQSRYQYDKFTGRRVGWIYLH